MKELLMKYKEIIMYLVFGVLTTVVNIVVYFLSAELLHINYLISNALAWFLSVLFAYITNRKYVFESSSQNILKEAGADFSDVVKTTVFIKDMNEFAQINEVYAEYFGENKPARACVEVARLPKDVMLEIEAIATK